MCVHRSNVDRAGVTMSGDVRRMNATYLFEFDQFYG